MERGGEESNKGACMKSDIGREPRYTCIVHLVGSNGLTIL